MKVSNLKSLMPDRSSVLRYFARTSSEQILGKEPLLFRDGSLSKNHPSCVCVRSTSRRALERISLGIRQTQVSFTLNFILVLVPGVIG